MKKSLFEKIKRHWIIVTVGFIASLVIGTATFIEKSEYLAQYFSNTETQDQLTPETIPNFSVGSTQEFISKLLGPPEKILNTTQGKEVSLWQLPTGVIIGIIYEEKKVGTLFVYSYSCEKEISVLNASLCKELPKYWDDWDSLFGAQNVGYVERKPSDRSTMYLNFYSGAEGSALDLITYIHENKEYFTKNINTPDPMMQKFIELRKGIKANFIVFSETEMSAKEVLDIYYKGFMNFHFLSS